MLIFVVPLQTSASLKFTVLNPKGRIWTMVAGGGASVIYADTVNNSHLPSYSTFFLHSSYLLFLGLLIGYYFSVLPRCFAIKLPAPHISSQRKMLNMLFDMPNPMFYLGWWSGLCIGTWELCRVQWCSKWGWGFAVCQSCYRCKDYLVLVCHYHSFLQFTLVL